METTFDDGFEEYKDKMNKLANAYEAEAFQLGRVADECRSVASECQTVADLISKTTDGLIDLKEGLIPKTSGN